MIRNANGDHPDIEQIAAPPGVSPVALRRDLVALQEEGLVMRGCGKAAVDPERESDPGALSDLINRIAMRAAHFAFST